MSYPLLDQRRLSGLVSGLVDELKLIIQSYELWTCELSRQRWESSSYKDTSYEDMRYSRGHSVSSDWVGLWVVQWISLKSDHTKIWVCKYGSYPVSPEYAHPIKILVMMYELSIQRWVRSSYLYSSYKYTPSMSYPLEHSVSPEWVG